MIIEELLQHHHSFFVIVEMTCYFGKFSNTPSSSNKEHRGQIVPKKTIYEKHSMNIACLRIMNQKHFHQILTRRLIYTFEKWFKTQFYVPIIQSAFLQALHGTCIYILKSQLVDLSFHHELAL
jgi:hypothetical protein